LGSGYSKSNFTIIVVIRAFHANSLGWEVLPQGRWFRHEGKWFDKVKDMATAKKKTTSKKAPAKKVPAKKAPAKKVVAYNPNAKDGDNDGILQDGTVWERPVKTKRSWLKKLLGHPPY
jgi:hypothetical protein